MKLLYLLPAVTALISASPTSVAADNAAVASIKPVHSLVAGVMQGVGAPTLLVQGAASPYSYSLKPSQASAIEKADLIFWIGHQIETFLENTVESVGVNAKSVELIDTAELVRLTNRLTGISKRMITMARMTLRIQNMNHTKNRIPKTTMTMIPITVTPVSMRISGLIH